MQFDRGSTGDISSHFLVSASGRQINLSGGKNNASALQLLSSAWMNFVKTLRRLLDEYDKLLTDKDSDGNLIIDAFRRVIYDGTEILDIYAQLIPERVGFYLSKKSELFRSYVNSAKRLRAPCALICNKLKHSGAQIAYVRAMSRKNSFVSIRYMVCIYENSDSLVTDKDIHTKVSSTDVVKMIFELMHSILRLDITSSNLMRTLTDTECTPLPKIEGVLSISDVLHRLTNISPGVLRNESDRYDGLEIKSDKLILERQQAKRIYDPAEITTTFTADGITKSFSFG